MHPDTPHLQTKTTARPQVFVEPTSIQGAERNALEWHNVVAPAKRQRL
jgi:hypothetical protein